MLNITTDFITEAKQRICTVNRFDHSTDSDVPHKELSKKSWVSKDSLYCPNCAQERTVRIEVLKDTGVFSRLCDLTAPLVNTDTTNHETASMFLFTCEQCSFELVGLMYQADGKIKFAIFSKSDVGAARKELPSRILHFIEQGEKCLMVEAYGAALSMYRVAVEQILHDQGFAEEMLDAKIKALMVKIDNKTANEWAMGWSDSLLDVVKKIGNFVIHPKNLEGLKKHEAELAFECKAVVELLIYDIYESKIKQTKLLNKLTGNGNVRRNP